MSIIVNKMNTAVTKFWFFQPLPSSECSRGEVVKVVSAVQKYYKRPSEKDRACTAERHIYLHCWL